MTIYLFVPFEMKEQAKELGAKYDADVRQWYCEANNKKCRLMFDYKYFDVKYDVDEIARLKALGCRWSKEHKKWYTYEGNQNINV